MLLFIAGCSGSYNFEENSFEETEIIENSSLNQNKFLEDEVVNLNNSNNSINEIVEEDCDLNCSLNKSISMRDANLCLNLADLEERELCLKVLINNSIKISKEICENVSNSFKNSCINSNLKYYIEENSIENSIKLCSELENNKNCINILANIKNYSKICDNLDFEDRYICYQNSYNKNVCFDSDNSKVKESDNGFVCLNGICKKDFCYGGVALREQFCDENKFKEYTFTCDTGCFSGKCNLGFEGNKLIFEETYLSIWQDELTFNLIVGDGAKFIDIKNLEVEYVYGDYIEKKVYSGLKSNKYTFNGVPESETIYGERYFSNKTKFDSNDYIFHFFTQIEKIPNMDDSFMLKFIYDDEEFAIIAKKMVYKDTYKLEVLEHLSDKDLILKKEIELKKINISNSTDYSQINIKQKELELDCQNALIIGFTKEINNKCLKIDMMCTIIEMDTCKDGVKNTQFSCEGKFIKTGEYLIKELC